MTISKEHLESIVSGSEFDEDTKASAREQLIKIADNIKKETDIENLITAQTGGECLVILDSDNIEVILPDGTVKEDILLKIKDIIISKTDFSADKITVIERSNMKLVNIQFSIEFLRFRWYNIHKFYVYTFRTAENLVCSLFFLTGSIYYFGGQYDS